MADVVENLNALHKEVFSNDVPDLVPAYAKIQQLVKFDKKAELGLKYVQPVRLAYPGGFTQALGDGTAGAFSLNDAKSGTVKRAEVTAAQILLKDQMDYETAAKASSGGAKAFKEGTGFFYEGMQKAVRKRVESQLLYGNASIGKVSAYAAGTPSITIATSDWAAGIWAGMEGMEIDVQSGSTSTVRGTVTVAGVDIENRLITLSGTVTGAAANDLVYFKGGFATEMSGIYKIMANTGSLFGIDAAVYSLWKSYAKTVTAALQIGDVKSAIAGSVSKGLDEDLVLFLNPRTWDNVSNGLESLRRTDKGDIKKLDVGAEEIVIHSQNGSTAFVAHNMVKEGHGFGLCMPTWKRLGAADVTFGTPGFKDDMFRQIDGKAGIEARAYSHQCIFSSAPAKNFIITGIVNV